MASSASSSCPFTFSNSIPLPFLLFSVISTFLFRKARKIGKLKKNLSLVPVEPKAPDSGWWDSFFNPRNLEQVVDFVM
ncbi:hypothetical protein L3X38_015147 [Prunus dulcis]|uniref:Transmembrane protein n=1 Tax=Prunus dulcis TaxID=3755 RepID=A0AAD4WPJ0_PRUDU|nr:hypothetical protein L3X38_015147 [Prunus dulcis]